MDGWIDRPKGCDCLAREIVHSNCKFSGSNEKQKTLKIIHLFNSYDLKKVGFYNSQCV